MPISTDNARVSIDFLYEYETPLGETLQYQMKFQHTDNGATVTVSNGPYEPIELPADMFVEVAQFLVSQGALKGAALPVIKAGGQAPAQLTAGKVPLALPQIGRRLPTKSAVRGEPQHQLTQEVDANGVSQLPADIHETRELTEEEKGELANMKKARLAAKAKASAKKTIRHKD